MSGEGQALERAVKAVAIHYVSLLKAAREAGIIPPEQAEESFGLGVELVHAFAHERRALLRMAWRWEQVEKRSPNPPTPIDLTPAKELREHCRLADQTFTTPERPPTPEMETAMPDPGEPDAERD